jgi:hypothetical protein
MEIKAIIAFGGFIISIFGSRMIHERAMKPLSQELKAKLIDVFSGQRTVNMILGVLIVLGFFATTQMQLLDPEMSMYGFLAVLLSFLGYSAFRMNKTLIKENYPSEFRTQLLFSSLVKAMGISICFASLILISSNQTL